MGQKSIIVNTPNKKNHSDAQDWAAVFNGLYGGSTGILPIGSKLVVGVNEEFVIINDGVFSLDGHMLRVKDGTKQFLKLPETEVGKKRIAYVVAQYVVNTKLEDDTLEFAILAGEQDAINPLPPQVTIGNIDRGDRLNQAIIAELLIDGNKAEVNRYGKKAIVLPRLSNELPDGTQKELDRRFNDLVINVKDYGVRGDGVTDDTKAIQDVIDKFTNFTWKGSKKETYLKARYGYVFYFPKGVYRITNSIFLAPYTTIKGESNGGYNFHNKEIDFTKNGSVLLTDFNKPIFALEGSPLNDEGGRRTDLNDHIDGITNTNYDRMEGIKIKGMTIMPKGETQLLGGINLKSCPFSLVEETYIYKADFGIYIESNWCTDIIKTATMTWNYGIIAFKGVNRININNCFIDHAGGTIGKPLGGGIPIRRYNNSIYDFILGVDAPHVPDKTNEEYTTGVYTRTAWQISIKDCSVQYWERAFMLRQSNVTVDTVWLEWVRHIDFQHTHGKVHANMVRKETTYSKLLRSTAGGTIQFNGVTGAAANGYDLPSDVQLIDFKDGKTNIVFIDTNINEPIYSKGVDLNSLSFLTGGVNIQDINILNGNLTGVESETIDYPKNFINENTIILSCDIVQTNGVVMSADYYKGGKITLLNPSKKTGKYKIMVARIG